MCNTCRCKQDALGALDVGLLANGKEDFVVAIAKDLAQEKQQVHFHYKSCDQIHSVAPNQLFIFQHNSLSCRVTKLLLLFTGRLC